MAKPKKRIDTRAEPEPLTSNPFAALRGTVPSMPEAAAPEPAPSTPKSAARPYAVAKTRKGGWPLSVERRAGGKWVTIVGNVTGDAAALLAALRKHCGAGGAVRDGQVEIQGDHRAAIERFLSA